MSRQSGGLLQRTACGLPALSLRCSSLCHCEERSDVAIYVANFRHHGLTPEEFLKTSGVICKIIQKGTNFTITPEVSADSSGVIPIAVSAFATKHLCEFFRPALRACFERLASVPASLGDTRKNLCGDSTGPGKKQSRPLCQPAQADRKGLR